MPTLSAPINIQTITDWTATFKNREKWDIKENAAMLRQSLIICLQQTDLNSINNQDFLLSLEKLLACLSDDERRALSQTLAANPPLVGFLSAYQPQVGNVIQRAVFHGYPLTAACLLGSLPDNVREQLIMRPVNVADYTNFTWQSFNLLHFATRSWRDPSRTTTAVLQYIDKSKRMALLTSVAHSRNDDNLLEQIRMSSQATVLATVLGSLSPAEKRAAVEQHLRAEVLSDIIKDKPFTHALITSMEPEERLAILININRKINLLPASSDELFAAIPELALVADPDYKSRMTEEEFILDVMGLPYQGKNPKNTGLVPYHARVAFCLNMPHHPLNRILSATGIFALATNLPLFTGIVKNTPHLRIALSPDEQAAVSLYHFLGREASLALQWPQKDSLKMSASGIANDLSTGIIAASESLLKSLNSINVDTLFANNKIDLTKHTPASIQSAKHRLETRIALYRSYTDDLKAVADLMDLSLRFPQQEALLFPKTLELLQRLQRCAIIKPPVVICYSTDYPRDCQLNFTDAATASAGKSKMLSTIGRDIEQNIATNLQSTLDQFNDTTKLELAKIKKQVETAAAFLKAFAAQNQLNPLVDVAKLQKIQTQAEQALAAYEASLIAKPAPAAAAPLLPVTAPVIVATPIATPKAKPKLSISDPAAVKAITAVAAASPPPPAAPAAPAPAIPEIKPKAKRKLSKSDYALYAFSLTALVILSLPIITIPLTYFGFRTVIQHFKAKQREEKSVTPEQSHAKINGKLPKQKKTVSAETAKPKVEATKKKTEAGKLRDHSLLKMKAPKPISTAKQKRMP